MSIQPTLCTVSRVNGEVIHYCSPYSSRSRHRCYYTVRIRPLPITNEQIRVDSKFPSRHVNGDRFVSPASYDSRDPFLALIVSRKISTFERACTYLSNDGAVDGFSIHTNISVFRRIWTPAHSYREQSDKTRFGNLHPTWSIDFRIRSFRRGKISSGNARSCKD